MARQIKKEKEGKVLSLLTDGADYLCSFVFDMICFDIKYILVLSIL